MKIHGCCAFFVITLEACSSPDGPGHWRAEAKAAFDIVDHALLSASLVCVTTYWNGSGLTCRIEHFASCTAVIGLHHAQLSFFVRSHKDQCLVRDCSFCTSATLPTKSTNMVSTSIIHAYADDSQLYVHCNRCDTALTAARLELCITDIGH